MALLRSFLFLYMWMIRSSFSLSLRDTIMPSQQFRAWTCGGSSQAELCHNLQSASILRSDSVRQIMLQTDRRHYISQTPYLDAPQNIGLGQTISAPHMHARVLEDLRPHIEHIHNHHLRMLDVGCGSGYLTACLGRWCRTKAKGGGYVVGIDVRTELVEAARNNIRADDPTLLDYISLRVSNGWELRSNEGLFHAIHVGAAASELPINLAMQLCERGAMVIPIGDTKQQSLYKIVREKVSETFRPEDFHMAKLLDVRYVPLVREIPGGLAP